MKENVMNRLEKVLYTAKAHITGGRTGMSRSSDGRLEVRLSRPGSPDPGTNPEQLFAAGWSACFESSMEFVARNMKITLPADHAVDAEIDLGPEGGAFSLAARLYVSLPGMERATAQRLVEAAHQVCPIRGQHTGTSPSKRRWSEAVPMRADSDRLISVHAAEGEGP
jgi:osmotically inducible protein OsmC